MNSSHDAGKAPAQPFLQRLDHDLRTPIGTLAAGLELLRTEPCGTALHAETMAVLERQVARLHGLTEKLRDFSQSLDATAAQFAAGNGCSIGTSHDTNKSNKQGTAWDTP